MTNPDNIVRVRARLGGRASVYEANGWAQAYTSGLLEGNGVIQNTSADMNVLVGGSVSKPDVVLAENPAGYKIALDIVGQQAVTITAPASNSRISAVVAYTDDLSLPTTEDTVTGSPASCGLIVVNGAAASSPVQPSDAQIRTAITADGGTGSQASYCVIATIEVANDTTIITDSLITKNTAILAANKVTTASIEDGAITADKIDFGTLHSYSTKVENIAIATTTEDIASYTIPAKGKYLVLVNCNLHTVAAQHSTYITLMKNGSQEDSGYVGIHENYWGLLDYSTIGEYNEGDILKITMRDTYGIVASANTKIRFQVIQISNSF